MSLATAKQEFTLQTELDRHTMTASTPANKTHNVDSSVMMSPVSTATSSSVAPKWMPVTRKIIVFKSFTLLLHKSFCSCTLENDCFSGEKDCNEYLLCGESGSCIGDLVSSTVTEDEDECLALCQADPECQYYTFRSINGHCTLTKNCSVDMVTCPETCVYGQRECERDIICGDPGSCVGNMVLFTTTDDEEECLDLCQETTDCNYYTFKKLTSYCTLTSNCTVDTSSCATCVYGEKGCGLETVPTFPFDLRGKP